MASQMIIIHPRDNVAIALRDFKQGESLSSPDGRTLVLLSDIPYSHKVALEDIPVGSEVFKYGEVIGEARAFIRQGDWVHTHNLDIEDKARR